MKSISFYKDCKIDTKKLNYINGGGECTLKEVITSTNTNPCGDERKTWYNEDKTICCTQTTNLCCYA